MAQKVFSVEVGFGDSSSGVHGFIADHWWDKDQARMAELNRQIEEEKKLKTSHTDFLFDERKKARKKKEREMLSSR